MADGKVLKTAMVGLRHGHVGTFGPEKPGYIHTLRHLEGLEVVAYCEDVDSSKLDEAHEHHPEAGLYDSVDDLIARQDFDLAWVTLPASEVPPTGIKLAEAGKDFYMEKQFARTSDELAELARAVRRNQVKVLPGYPHRFNPVAQDLKQMIDQGVLGKPLDLEVRMVTGQVRPGVREPGGFLYSRNDEGGGILHMLGGHYIDVMRFLMGCEMKSVQAMTGRPVGHIEEPLEDVAIAAFQFENGAYGSIHAGYLQSARSSYDIALVFRGLDGEASWRPSGSPRLEVKSATPAWAAAPHRTL